MRAAKHTPPRTPPRPTAALDAIGNQARLRAVSARRRAGGFGGPSLPLRERDPALPGSSHQVAVSSLSAPPVPAIALEVAGEGGRPLDVGDRERFEALFDRDLSRVRLHDGPRANRAARAVGAVAYTVGQHVVFRDGAAAFGGLERRKLLAHELAHTVQQRGAGATDPVGWSNAASERAAENAARGGSASLQPPSPRALARQGDHGAAADERLPPGQGRYTPKEYEQWRRAHPRYERRVVGPWEPKFMYERYSPQWFKAHGYVYAGRGGNVPWYWFEVWVSDRDGGKEFRVWRTALDAEAGSAPTAAPPSTPQKQTSSQSDYLDPDADRESLFGPVIAAREGVDVAFGEGDVVLYEDGSVELFLEGTTRTYVFRPVQGGRYVVYGPDGRRLEKVWTIPAQDIPDPIDDAVE